VDDSNIKEALQKRKKNGGCGMWKNVGIPFMYKNHKDKLSDEDITWYEENLSYKKEDMK